MIVFADTETFSEIPIKNGSYKYAEGAEVMLFTYAFDDGPVKLWDRTKDPRVPADLQAAFDDPETLWVFHNGGNFDRVVIEKSLGVRIPPERIYDTMAAAYSHGFPGGLEILCDILNVPVSKAKDKDGKKLIQLFCVPRSKKSSMRRATRLTHPLEWDRFCTYATLDIEAMRFIFNALPKWNYTGFEKTLWDLDQKINERGIKIDVPFAEAAVRAIKRAQETLATRTSDLTMGLVETATKRDALLRHILAAYDVELPDMQASTLEHRLEDPNLPQEVKELLNIRLQASSTSTAKYAVFIRNTNSDGRLRGSLQFAGAARTKRWAGRGVQLQNLTRPTLKQSNIDFGIRAICADAEELFYDNVMELCANAVRGCIIADEGKKLCVSDLANIEGRVAAWMAGEEWKLDAFRAYDDVIGRDAKGKKIRRGSDLYKVSYANAFKIKPHEVDDGADSGPQRQIGKVMELMLQYQGGVGAFLTGAASYSIDLSDMAKKALPEIPRHVIEQATYWWDESVKRKLTYDLDREVFLACDGLKRLWRLAHPRISSMWDDLEDAARNAIDSKGKTYHCRKLSFIRTGNWLRMVLPSGFYLCYAAPRVKDNGEISYMGMNQYSRRWSRLKTYGGKLLENAVQAASRDIMAWNMPVVEEYGYPIITHTHDELVTEPVDDPRFTADKLSLLLAANPDWALDLPLAAGGFESYRYKKAD